MENDPKEFSVPLNPSADGASRRVQFDNRLTRYWMWGALGMCLVMVWTIPLIPVVLLCYCLGTFDKYLSTKEVELTPRAVVVRSGGRYCGNCCCFERKENTILLDRIQDVRLSQGCLQKCFGLHRITIETAGRAGPDAGPEATLDGIVDAAAFRDLLLARRHQYVETKSGGDLGTGGQQRDFSLGAPRRGADDGSDQVVPLLREIAASLARLERQKDA